MKNLLKKRNKDEEFTSSRRKKLLLASENSSIKESELSELLEGLSIAAIDYQYTDSDGVIISGSTALHVASEHGNTRVVHQLLERGANVTLTDNCGQTPLHWATRANQVECARLLVSSFPGLVNWQDYGGHTPLHLAARGTENQPLLDIILSVPSVSLTPLDNHFATPLHVAGSCGSSLAVESLLKRGVVPDKWRDDGGATPLHYAALHGHWDVFQCLSSASSSQNPEDNAGLSPFLWACLGQDIDDFVRPYVIQNSCALETERTHNGASALHLAAQTGNLTQIAALLELDVSKCVEDALKLTPLHYAAAAGRVDAVQLLLFSSPVTFDVHGRGPLHWAARNEHLEICRLLMNAEEGRGKVSRLKSCVGDALRRMTPLHMACICGNVETVAAVLSRSRPWTCLLDADGYSPLHLAAYHGHVEVCKLLLDRVAPRKRALAANLCHPGVTALDVALHRGGTLVSELLIARGGLTAKERREAAAVIVQRATRRFLKDRRRMYVRK